MADEIKLNKAEAENAINELNSVVLDMEKIHSELLDNHSKLESQWNGESAAMFGKYSEIMGANLKGRIDGLKQLIDNLEKGKETFVEVDQNVLKSN